MIVYQKAKDGDLELKHGLHTYFYTVCRNIWFNRFKKNNKVDDLSNDVIPLLADTSDSFDEDIREQARYHLYRSKFRLLGENCKNILEQFFTRKTMKEIAEQLNLGSEGYAKKKKYKCQRKLVELIKSDELFNELTA